MRPRVRGENDAAAVYRLLTGCTPADAVIDDDDAFDRHVLASILAVAATDGAMMNDAGLSEPEFALLLARWFPAAAAVIAARPARAADPDDEMIMVRDLLLGQRSSPGETGGWLAAMIARRSMEPNHLWEDLGLRDRAELTRMLTRHFAPLAQRNTRNMRWKRFFYRMMCEDDGFVMCTTPVCTNCADFNLCFGEESGESRMADRRRELLSQAGAIGADANLVFA
ncbi:MAG: nitrogen fixation protein NifQ [Xanthobacteraceae bacterium]|nr:nitrogen fixation protein NifQ [Xanthobacteraceae bacterium]